MKKIFLTTIILLMSLFFFCKKNQVLYSWVDKTRVRHLPSFKKKAFTFLKEGEKVVWKGIESNKKIKITLRGKKFNTPFYKVQLENGKEGWVYAGALSIKKPKKPDFILPYKFIYSKQDARDCCDRLSKTCSYDEETGGESIMLSYGWTPTYSEMKGLINIFNDKSKQEVQKELNRMVKSMSFPDVCKYDMH